MICRFTSKLSKKIGVAFGRMGILENAASPFSDWSANLFRAERIQYIIFSNSPSLFSVVFPGAGITNFDTFIKQALDSIEMMCKEYEFKDIYSHVFKAFNEDFQFSKIGDRSLNGSIVDLIHQAQYHLVYQGLSPFLTGFKLNEVPMSYLKMAYPREAFKDLTIVN